MPKDDDLDLQFAIRARTTGPDHAAEQRVEESEQHDRAMLHRGWSGRRVSENVPFTRSRRPRREGRAAGGESDGGSSPSIVLRARRAGSSLPRLARQVDAVSTAVACALTRPLRCRNPCAARLRGWPLRSRGASGRAVGGSFGSSRSCAPAPGARGDEPRPGSCPNRP